LGYVVEFGPWRVYHSGDTLVYDGLADQLKQWAIDAAILPINGRGPERRVAGNMWGDEAARLASEAGVGCVIPCHYEMFAFNTQSPAQFITTCQQLGQGHAVLRAGGCWSSPMQQ
jgi:L-ascorbate metabolism protein UlaG (beta-lactamase superfamily)